MSIVDRVVHPRMIFKIHCGGTASTVCMYVCTGTEAGSSPHVFFRLCVEVAVPCYPLQTRHVHRGSMRAGVQ